MFLIRELCNNISSPVRFGETDRGGAASPRTCHSLEQQQHQQVERQQPQDDDQHLLVLNGDSSRDGAVRSVVDSWAQAGGSHDCSSSKKKEGRR